MPNLSPSDSFSIKLKSSHSDLISVLTTKTKTTKEKRCQREKRNNETVFFSNNQTQPISKNSSSPTIKHNNQRETTKLTNPRPTWGFARIRLHRFCWSCWDRIRVSRVDWIRSMVVSHFVLFHISRSMATLGFFSRGVSNDRDKNLSFVMRGK